MIGTENVPANLISIHPFSIAIGITGLLMRSIVIRSQGFLELL